VDRDYGNDARSLGASEVRIFLRLILPRAWPYLLLAVVVALFIPLSGLL
jgi:ABC-type nitrate/sulfonate/bicarbonate transport system permease component